MLVSYVTNETLLPLTGHYIKGQTRAVTLSTLLSNVRVIGNILLVKILGFI